jgi:hypothetical protein
MARTKGAEHWSVEETNKLIEALRKLHLRYDGGKSRLQLLKIGKKELEKSLPSRNLKSMYSRLAYLRAHNYMSSEYLPVSKQKKQRDPNRKAKPVSSTVKVVKKPEPSKPNYVAFPGLRSKEEYVEKPQAVITRLTTFVREQTITITVPVGTVMETFDNGYSNIRIPE